MCASCLYATSLSLRRQSVSQPDDKPTTTTRQYCKKVVGVQFKPTTIHCRTYYLFCVRYSLEEGNGWKWKERSDRVVAPLAVDYHTIYPSVIHSLDNNNALSGGFIFCYSKRGVPLSSLVAVGWICSVPFPSHRIPLDYCQSYLQLVVVGEEQ